MKHILIATLFSILGTTAFAQSHPFGLGLMLGSPTGISAKYILNKANSIDGALAWNLGDDNTSFQLHSDYLWQKSNMFRDLEAIIDLYYGVGLRFVSTNPPRHADDEDKSKFGPRIPVGLRHMFRDPRIEIFLEVALIFNIIPSTNINLDLGVGGRYYF